jgi:hypothetical protein
MFRALYRAALKLILNSGLVPRHSLRHFLPKRAQCFARRYRAGGAAMMRLCAGDGVENSAPLFNN